MVLLSMGAVFSPAQEASQQVGQTVEGVDRRVQADATFLQATGAGSSPTTSASKWEATRGVTASAQPASSTANTIVRQLPGKSAAEPATSSFAPKWGVTRDVSATARPALGAATSPDRQLPGKTSSEPAARSFGLSINSKSVDKNEFKNRMGRPIGGTELSSRFAPTHGLQGTSFKTGVGTRSTGSTGGKSSASPRHTLMSSRANPVESARRQRQLGNTKSKPGKIR
jgi:hypothetical protein